jgi:PadR family transcriptional regulator, regulatory protein PadR
MPNKSGILSFMLGELEVLILFAVVQCEEDAYGVGIHSVILERTLRDVPMGSIYVSLDRLERKGLLTSDWSMPQAMPGGRRRRVYKISDAGRKALQAHRESFLAMSRGFEEQLERRAT